jgi:two-component system, OmpR family, sensor histidine kinase BaeS
MFVTFLQRLRILHQLWLLLLIAVVLAVLAVGGVVAWNLRAGFGDYLRARDTQQMTRLAALVAEMSAQDPQLEWLRGGPSAMRSLMDEFSQREGLLQPRSGPPSPEQVDLPAQAGRPALPRRAPPGGAIGPRTQIYDAQGQWLAGRGQVVGLEVMQAPIRINGQVVGTVRVTVEPDEEGVDSRFLRRQYIGLLLAGLSTIALSLLLGGLIARRWSQPLRDVQQATQRIAKGQFEVRLQATGAREISDLAHDINHMAQSLQQLEQSRRAWIAQNSHELRTPLAVLLGEIESVQDGVRRATPEVMENLREEVMQLTRLVNDLHLLSVADMGALPCEFLDGDAVASLQRIAQRYEPRLAQHGLTLKTHGPRKVLACWDFGRIEQLLINLLENSLRYTDAPGRVQLLWETVWLDKQPALRISVDDTAPGVKDTDLPQLFEPLFRADASRQRLAQHGSGLGLAIVRAIVDAHQGTINAHHSPMGGVQMVVQLPLNHSASDKD